MPPVNLILAMIAILLIGALLLPSGCSPITTCENPAYADYCGDLAGKSVTIDKRAAWFGVQ